MSRIIAKFEELGARNEKALVLFLTAGDQSLSDLPEILATLEEGGADLIEVGIPFSDPFGEGPTIQASSQRSLDNGTTPMGILEALSNVKVSVPLVTMGYYNTYLRLGLEQVAKESAKVGVSGAIISDLIPDEGEAWDRAAASAGLDTIYLAAPTSTDQRLDEVCGQTTGFVYAVSRTGVTGAESEVPPEVKDLVTRIKVRTNLPVCVGFGISKPEHVRMVCQHADGAVVGSFIVNLLKENWPHNRGAIIGAIRELKAATQD
ncbi:MAG: tryptophan synthase subunit alpha [Armatimonadetes bacterium 55-13]|nr:tryptophan synthase subunit alpha [Armatimonadota bacterium]OJU63500.1 MAG: tryptophan synthase subunit alpha [Armatimonadetes bacterium 55-13]